MKIHNLSYSSLKNTLEKKQLLLDLDFKSDNTLFRTEKIFSAKSCRAESKFEFKHRTLSAASGKSVKPKENQKNSSKTSRLRPATSSSTRKGQKTVIEIEQNHPRPRTATNRFYTGMDLIKKNKKEDIFLELSKEIKRYFSSIITDEEKSETLEQLKLILNILQKEKDPNLVFLQLQKLQSQLSRFLKHRICHLFFYLVYYKFHECFSNEPPQKELKLLTLAEYHARTFYFRKVALLICLEIQQKFVRMNNYEESRKYAIKSLKLAVLNNDRYEQVKMLEYIGVLKYYEGVLNVNGSNLLTEQQRINILKLYNEEDQIPKIFNFLDKDPTTRKSTEGNKQNAFNEDEIISSFQKDKIYFNQGQNFVKNNVPSTNLKKFNRNFHGIGKNLKNAAVKHTIKKVNEVGEVKKFFGRENYITLYPQGNTIKNIFQSQVLVTHKKYASMQKGKKFVNNELPLIINKLQSLILTEIYMAKLDSRDKEHHQRQWN